MPFAAFCAKALAGIGSRSAPQKLTSAGHYCRAAGESSQGLRSSPNEIPPGGRPQIRIDNGWRDPPAVELTRTVREHRS
jgi:hypothetical protein